MPGERLISWRCIPITPLISCRRQAPRRRNQAAASLLDGLYYASAHDAITGSDKVTGASRACLATLDIACLRAAVVLVVVQRHSGRTRRRRRGRHSRQAGPSADEEMRTICREALHNGDSSRRCGVCPSR